MTTPKLLRRLRFSLRTLFVVMLACYVAIGFIMLICRFVDLMRQTDTIIWGY